MTWGVVALILSAAAGGWTWHAFRNRGIASGTRGLALVLLPLAAWLTGTLKLVGRIVDAVGDWALGLVFNPAMWTGIGMAGLAVVLFVVSGLMPGNKKGPAQVEGSSSPEVGAKQNKQKRGNDGGIAETLGDDTDDIQAILRKHGIS